jgi:hypothetical protein
VSFVISMCFVLVGRDELGMILASNSVDPHLCSGLSEICQIVCQLKDRPLCLQWVAKKCGGIVVVIVVHSSLQAPCQMLLLSKLHVLGEPPSLIA